MILAPIHSLCPSGSCGTPKKNNYGVNSLKYDVFWYNDVKNHLLHENRTLQAKVLNVSKGRKYQILAPIHSLCSGGSQSTPKTTILVGQQLK